MPVKAIIFDWGGVLVRTLDLSQRRAWGRRLSLTAEALEGIVFGAETGWDVQLGRVTDEEHWSWVQRRLQLDDAGAVAFRHDFFAGDRQDDDLIRYIDRLRRRYHLGLLSNATSRARALMRDTYGLLEHFDSVTISSEEGVMKPDPRIFEIALARAGAEAGEAVFVDDALRNIEGARELGIQTVHFADPAAARRQLITLTGVT